MFIPYTAPSSEDNRNTRRTINTFIAVNASVKRRRRKDADNKIGLGNATGVSTGRMKILQWIHTTSHRHNHTPPDPPTLPSGADRQQQQEEEEPLPLAAAAGGRNPFGNIAPLTGGSPLNALLSPSIAGNRFYPINIDSQGPFLNQGLSYYFDVLVPYDAKVVGMAVSEEHSYTTELLAWTFQHPEIMHSLAAFSLCILQNHSHTRSTEQAILHHRQRLLEAVHYRLSKGQVDDVLIQIICIMISVDEYLGFSEYRSVHLKGFRDVVRIREASDTPGRSTSSLDPSSNAKHQSMAMLVHTSKKMVEFHLESNLVLFRDTMVVPTVTFPPPSSVPDIEKRMAGLPPGLMVLVRSGILTEKMTDLLQDFSFWFYQGMGMDPTNRESWRYSNFKPENRLEQCISMALLCLADDLSSMGTHPCAVIFRQTKQRVQFLSSFTELWASPLLAECMIWMCTVIAIPRNRTLLAQDEQMALLRRSVRNKALLRYSGQIAAILQRFFYDQSREADWQEAWNLALTVTANQSLMGC
ncbi:hypothetical protein Asppvi_011433 [Aspergillus pseudoviridinutans]|uniref:Uncharacterized protein n=1 Tax=Aspergillus pseudoviridinutans TaxID=1517512 RepID=A0A9P3BRP0_9EURO|nr:uncharacterized protein Asppvi_011433 [Aspergillus pseudoviridinutans]GIJ92451.1 hypothetical protein Asppvi_011433 [Aspergillus pseudoviridinutans]